MEIYLAIDGGQSHSSALIADQNGHILGFEKGGPCNHFDEPGGETRFRETLINITRGALKSAGFPLSQPILSACLGLTGYWERATDIIQPVFQIQHIMAVEDTRTAQAAAFGGGPGIIVIAGTGAVGYGIDAQGREARSGGWGYLMADEGSGYDLGRRALQAVSQAVDGRGAATILVERILAHFGKPDFGALHQYVYKGPIARSEIAGLAKIVAQAAQENDPVAVQLIQTAARNLVQYVLAVARQLEWEDPLVSPIGGVFLAKEVILKPFQQTLYEVLPRAQVKAPQFPQIIGALILAYRAKGLAMERQLLVALENEVSSAAFLKEP